MGARVNAGTAVGLIGALGCMGLLLLPARAAADDIGLLREGARVDLSTGRLLSAPEELEADKRGRLSAPLRLEAAQDEVVAFQVVVSGAPGIRAVRFEPFGGVTPALYAERAIIVREPSASDAIVSLGPASYPDALVPTSTLAVPPAPGVAALWVDLYVPRDASPGERRGRLSIGGGAAPYELEVVLVVAPIRMPARDVARLGAVSFGSLLEREKRSPSRFLEWMQLLHAHYLTPELMRMLPPRAEPIDWDAWAARVAPFVEGSAYTSTAGYVGPRAGVPITRFIAPHCEHWPVSADPSGHRPADPQRWMLTLREWEARLLARGWWSRPQATEWLMFINSLDEPKTGEALEAIRSYQTLLDGGLSERRHLSFRVDGVLGPRIEGWSDARRVTELGGVVDIWDLHGAPNTAPLALLAPRREPPYSERLMFYASGSGGEPAIPPLVLDAPLSNARAWGWVVARYGLDGALNWELDLAPGCVREPRCSEGGALNLDALLVYRGEELGRAQDEPIASMRLKLLRRGAQDAALLSLLSERDPQAAAALARRLVPRALGDGDLPSAGRGRWPYDPKAYEEARTEILDRLLGRPVARRPGWGFWVQIGGALLVVVVILSWQRRRRAQ